MTLNLYLWGMRIGVLLSFSALSLVVIFIDPEQSGIIGKLLFYFSLFFTITGFFNLLLVWIKQIFLREEDITDHLGINLRQSILLSMIIIVFLVFQGLRIFIWWDALLVVAGFFLIELFFLFREDYN